MYIDLIEFIDNFRFFKKKNKKYCRYVHRKCKCHGRHLYDVEEQNGYSYDGEFLYHI